VKVAPGRGPQSFLVPWRWLFISLLMGLLATGVSFATIQYFAREHIESRRPDPGVVREANMLRDFNNELVRLCNGYARRTATGDGPRNSQTREWVERVYVPELRYLTQRIEERFPAGQERATKLLGAVDRAMALARHGDSPTARTQALTAVAAVAMELETWIAGYGLSNRLGRPAEPVQFP